MVRKMAEMHNNANSTNGSKKNATNNGDWYDDIINHDMEMDDHQPQANNWDRMEMDGGTDSEAGSQNLLWETLLYGKVLQAEFKDDPRKEVSKALEDAFSLLAYKDPINEKTVSHIMDLSGRVAVAEELNSAILRKFFYLSSFLKDQHTLFSCTYVTTYKNDSFPWQIVLRGPRASLSTNNSSLRRFERKRWSRGFC